MTSQPKAGLADWSAAPWAGGGWWLKCPRLKGPPTKAPEWSGFVPVIIFVCFAFPAQAYPLASRWRWLCTLIQPQLHAPFCTKTARVQLGTIPALFSPGLGYMLAMVPSQLLEVPGRALSSAAWWLHLPHNSSCPCLHNLSNTGHRGAPFLFSQ